MDEQQTTAGFRPLSRALQMSGTTYDSLPQVHVTIFKDLGVVRGDSTLQIPKSAFGSLYIYARESKYLLMMFLDPFLTPQKPSSEGTKGASGHSWANDRKMIPAQKTPTRNESKYRRCPGNCKKATEASETLQFEPPPPSVLGEPIRSARF